MRHIGAVDSANTAYKSLKAAAIGGIRSASVLGCGQAVHILTPSATVPGIVNMAALTVADANSSR